MAAQPLRPASASFALNRLEHAGHGSRIVTGTRHQLRAEEVRLPFVLAAVLQEVSTEAELGALRNDRAGSAADDGAENLSGDGADLKFLSFGRLRSSVARRSFAASSTQWRSFPTPPTRRFC